MQASVPMTRSAAFPDVPTLKESGVNWSFTNWFALVAPKGLPAEVRARLIEAGAKAHAKPEVQDPLKQRGFNPNWSGPEKAREFALGFATSTRDVLTDLGLAKP